MLSLVVMWSGALFFQLIMSEKDIIIIWSEAVELFKSDPNDLSSTRQAAEKLESLISSNPQQGVSKLCYNVSVLRTALGDKVGALKVCLGSTQCLHSIALS